MLSSFRLHSSYSPSFSLVIAFVVIFIGQVHAQVSIKEKTSINPDKVRRRLAEVGQHTIRLYMRWSPGYPTADGRMLAKWPCASSTGGDPVENAPYSSEIDTSFISAPEGLYEIVPQGAVGSPGDTMTFWTCISLDDSVVAADTSICYVQYQYGYSPACGGCAFQFGTRKYFRIETYPDTIAAGSFSRITPIALDCSGLNEISVNPAAAIVFSTDAPPPYAGFVVDGDTTGPELDKTVTYATARAGHVHFAADTSFFTYLGGDTVRTCNITAGFDGTRKNSVPITIVKPGPFAKFDIIATPDTIGLSDTATLVVIALDSLNREAIFPSGALLTLSIDSTTIGSFINPSGTKVPSPLTGIAYGDARKGKIKFVADGTNRSQDTIVNTVLQAFSEADPTFRGDGPLTILDFFNLFLLRPTTATEIDTISRTPSMPIIRAKARVTGRGNSAVVYIWRFAIKWDHVSPRYNHGDRDGTRPDSLYYIFSDTLTIANADTCDWIIPWDGRFCGGWFDTLSVSASCRGETLRQTRNRPYRILGMNASRDTMRSGLDTEMQVILYKEDWPGRRFLHFQADSTPSFGSPAGYGVAKLDPPSSKPQFWNWRENRSGGVAKLASARSQAIGYAQRVRNGGSYEPWYHGVKYPSARDLTDDELIYDRLQMYNGGHYWRWRPYDDEAPSGPGYWSAEPLRPYGKDAYDIRKKIIDEHTYPSDWNN